MKSHLLFAAVLASQANASNFEARVAEAKAAASTPGGSEYDKSIAPVVVSAMQACVPLGSKDPAYLGTFTLIGNVTADGELKDQEVSPTTKVSQCFLDHIATHGWPAPPLAPGSSAQFPVEITMTVKP